MHMGTGGVLLDELLLNLELDAVDLALDGALATAELVWGREDTGGTGGASLAVGFGNERWKLPPW